VNVNCKSHLRVYDVTRVNTNIFLPAREEKPLMTEIKRIKFITFRVTPDEYTQIERAASESDLESGNWCRDLALSVANGGQRFTINERILHNELSQLRFLVVHGFNRIFGHNAAEASAWDKLVTKADQSAKEIVIELQSGSKRG
jgi:hypothetical protein